MTQPNAAVQPKKRRPPHRSFDPRFAFDPETLSKAVIAHKNGSYDYAWDLYLKLDAESVARGRGPHWHARMMAALLWYQRTSKVDFDLPEDLAPTFGKQYRSVTAMLQDVILHLPKWADPLYNLGVILEGLGRIDEAARRFQRAIDIDSAYAEAHVNLGNCLLHQGKVSEAKVCFETAAQLNPDDPLAKYNLMHALALFGQWDQAYQHYEYRYLVPGHLRDHGLPRLIPRWDGRSFVDRLIVTDEQGAGDIIQFVRFLPGLQCYARKVYCRVRHPHLVSLLQYNFPRVEFFGADSRIPKADAHQPLLSCINTLRVPESEVPTPAGYLRPPPATETGVQYQGGVVWSHPASNTGAANTPTPNLGATSIKVGVCWAGSPTHKRDAVRSIPIETFKPILDTPNCQFVNLTVGTRAAVEHPALASPALTTYEESARLISTLDLVITVDTSVLHLSGALGVPTWGLIGASPDMRWMLPHEGYDGTTTPWYDSIRLQRQQRHDDWPSVIEEVRKDLTMLAQPRMA
jgi:hypothetical protein